MKKILAVLLMVFGIGVSAFAKPVDVCRGVEIGFIAVSLLLLLLPFTPYALKTFGFGMFFSTLLNPLVKHIIKSNKKVKRRYMYDTCSSRSSITRCLSHCSYSNNPY